MKFKTALVTGGAGFIGSHMVDLLVKKKIQVIVIDNLQTGHLRNLKHLDKNSYKFINSDIKNLRKKLKNYNNIDVIYHFAGLGDIVPSINNPEIYFETNVNGTLQVLEFMKEKKIRKLCYAASSSCYGLTKTYPTQEDTACIPAYPYAFTKYIGEKLCMHWKNIYNLNITSLRIFNAYGRRARTTGAYGAVFGVFFKQKLSNIPLTVVGNGRQKRDFIHVLDVVEAFYKASIKKTKSDIFNVGTGSPVSINYLVKMLSEKKVYIPKRPGEPDHTWADSSRLRSETGWYPKIKFEDGVKEMIQNIYEWYDAPLWTPKSIKIETKNWFKYLSN